MVCARRTTGNEECDDVGSIVVAAGPLFHENLRGCWNLFFYAHCLHVKIPCPHPLPKPFQNPQTIQTDRDRPMILTSCFTLFWVVPFRFMEWACWILELQLSHYKRVVCSLLLMAAPLEHFGSLLVSKIVTVNVNAWTPCGGPVWGAGGEPKENYFFQIGIYKSSHLTPCRSRKKSQKVPTMLFVPCAFLLMPTCLQREKAATF